jgi:hypothetical protein
LYEVALRVPVNRVAEEYSLTVRLVNGVPILKNILERRLRVNIQSKLLKYLRSLARRSDVNKQVMEKMKNAGSAFRPYQVDL